MALHTPGDRRCRKVGHHVACKALHHTPGVGMAVAAKVEVQDDFLNARGLYFLQRGNTLLDIAGNNAALAELLGRHRLQALDNVYKVGHVRRCRAAVVRKGGQHAVQVVVQALLGAEHLGLAIGQAEEV